MINLNILRALLFCPSPEGHLGLPAILWSAPGMGKTSLIKLLAATCNLPYYRLSPAERGDGYFGVVPVPGADGLLHYPPPADVVACFPEGRGLLFVDEISCAPPAMQAPLLGLVQLRTLGAYTFPAGVRVIGAANETRDAAGGWDLAPALANRFGHFEYTGLDADAWADGLLGGFQAPSAPQMNAADLEAHVMREWPAAFASAAGLVAGFIRRRPELLYKRPAKGSADHAWMSHRSNHYAATALASATVHKLSDSDTDEMLSAFVGRPWVTEFRTWSELLDLPAPADVLDGTVKFTHDERRPDRTVATLGSCAALITPVKAAKRAERMQRFWVLVNEIAKDAPDFVVGPARAVIMSGGWTLSAEQKSAMRYLLPILKAGGLA